MPCAALSPRAARLEFLFSAYEPRFWYWEVVETTRRLLLTAVLSVCAPGSSEQAVYAVLLALLYIKLYGYYAPYDEDNNVSERRQAIAPSHLTKLHVTF